MKLHFQALRKAEYALLAIAAVTLFLPLMPCRAQFPVQYPRQGQYPGQQYGQYPGAPFPGQQQQYQQPQDQTAQQQPQEKLPDGVDKLYALEGNNSLLAFATPDGYDRLREIVRNLDGDLDLIQTKIVAVEAPTKQLTALGVTLKAGDTSVSAADAAKLLAALANGRLTRTDSVRMTTREFTAIDALLQPGGTPLSFVPRVAKDGAVTLEISQPLTTMVSAQGGQTIVLAIPAASSESVRLLFLTPKILPSEYRP